MWVRSSWSSNSSREVERRRPRQRQRPALDLGDLEDVRFEASIAPTSIPPAHPLGQAEQAAGEHPEDAHLLLDQVDHVAGDQGRVATDVFDRAVVPGQFRRRLQQPGIERRLEDLRERGVEDHFQEASDRGRRDIFAGDQQQSGAERVDRLWRDAGLDLVSERRDRGVVDVPPIDPGRPPDPGDRPGDRRRRRHRGRTPPGTAAS